MTIAIEDEPNGKMTKTNSKPKISWGLNHYFSKIQIVTITTE